MIPKLCYDFKNIFFHHKTSIVFFFLIVLTPQLTFGQETADDKYGGTLVFSTISDPKSFNDIIAKETSTTTVTSYIFEGLTKTNAETLKVEPNLAKRWEIDESGLVWTFHLRRDVLWNDGERFTADDVVFTFNDLIYNDKIPSSARDIFTIDGQILKVKKVGRFAVKFILPVKFAPFLRTMSQAILPEHKLKSSVEEGTFNFTWGIDTDPNEIVGTGPYKLVKYQPGERLIFKRNILYWKKSEEGDNLPYIEKVVYLIVQSADVSALKFMDGEIDYTGVRGVDFPLLKPREKRDDFTLYEMGANFGTNFIFFNLNRGANPENNKPYVDPIKLKWFSNLDFRRAVAHAIDKKKMVEILKNGLGYPQHASMSPTAGHFYNPDVVEYEYDLEKSKMILTEAGFVDRDNDGIIEDSDGNKVEFNLFTNANTQERIQLAAIIRHDLQKLGMKVNFLALEFNSLVSKLIGSHDFDAVIIGLTGGIEPHDGKNVWHSSGQLHMWYPRQKEPATEWEARIDEIFTLGVQELDEDKRKVLYDEHQLIVSQNLPLIYTILGKNMFAVRNKFKNLNPTSYGGAFHNLEEIYIKSEFK